MCIRDRNISDINNPYEAFTLQTGGDCLSDDVMLNTEQGILAVPVRITEEEASKAADADRVAVAVSEVTTGTEATTETTTTVTETSSGESVNLAPGTYVQLYRPDMQAPAFTLIDTVTLDDNLPTDMPVSYTHLDVYKRQPVLLGEALNISLPECLK